MFTLIISTNCFASDALYVQVPVSMTSNATMPEAVKRECDIPMLLGNYIYNAVKLVYIDSEKTESESTISEGNLLKISIITVKGWGGGSWSGRKSISIKADLINNNEILTSTILKRASNGGVFGGFKGTCSILDRVAGALGKDTAKWVKANEKFIH